MTIRANDRHRAYLERSLGAHAAFTLQYHLVWSVKARRPVLSDVVADALADHLLQLGDEANIHVLALHVEPEHVHLLFSLRPDLAVAAAVKRLKGASSRFLRQTFPHLQELHEDALWNTGYFVRSLGDLNVAQAKAYLDRQRAHHGINSGVSRPPPPTNLRLYCATTLPCLAPRTLTCVAQQRCPTAHREVVLRRGSNLRPH